MMKSSSAPTFTLTLHRLLWSQNFSQSSLRAFYLTVALLTFPVRPRLALSLPDTSSLPRAWPRLHIFVFTSLPILGPRVLAPKPQSCI